MPNVDEESPRDACAGLLYHLLEGRLANGKARNDANDLQLLRLLLSDYGRRSASLPAPVQADLDRLVMGYLAGTATLRLWAEFRKTQRRTPQAGPLTLDVGIVTTSADDLRATALAFDARRARPHQLGDPAHVVTVDCTHGTGQRLSVGIFRTNDERPGSLNELITHMRHRRIPRLLCLAGSAMSVSATVSYLDVVAPHIIYSVKPNQLLSEADYFELRDPHLHGLEAYDLAHTGYQERFRTLLRRIPRQYRVGIRANNVSPRFAAERCITITEASFPLNAEAEADATDSAPVTDAVCIVDAEAYEFAESLPTETWLIFRGVQGLLPGDIRAGESTYLATAAAALSLRDFLENYYVPPGATDL